MLWSGRIGTTTGVNHSGQKRNFLLPLTLSDHIKIYTRFDRNRISPLSDIGRTTVKHVKPPLGLDFIVVAVHLPSKMHQTDLGHTFFAANLSEIINKAEIQVGHDRTLVIGDFNMNPFEDGLFAAGGLYAVMDRSTALKKQRTVQGIVSKYFYNPMWGLLGDMSSGPPGTYHYSSPDQSCMFWNTFDQVLLRPSLLDYFSNDGLKVLTGINGTNLLKANGLPDNKGFSDHLPITVNLTTEVSRLYFMV